MVLFKDMNKAASDLMNKDYCTSQTFEFEHKFKAANPNFTTSASFGPTSNPRSATFKFSHNKFWDEVKFGRSGIASVETGMVVPQVKGMKVGAIFDQKPAMANMKEGIEFNTEYTYDKFHGKFAVKPFSGNFNVSGMTTYKYNGDWMFGGEVKGGMDKSSIQYSAGAGYGSTNDQFSYFVSGVASSTESNAFGKYSFYAYGKTFSKQPSEYVAAYHKNTADSGANITFGGQWFVGDSSDTKVKAKIGMDMKGAVSVTQKMSEYVTATFGTQFDMAKQNGDSFKYGIKFNTYA